MSLQALKTVRALVEGIKGVASDLPDCEERKRLWQHLKLIDKEFIAISQAEAGEIVGTVLVSGGTVIPAQCRRIETGTCNCTAYCRQYFVERQRGRFPPAPMPATCAPNSTQAGGK